MNQVSIDFDFDFDIFGDRKKERGIFFSQFLFRIFGMRCSRCKAILQPDEIIMKTSGQVFHLQCFRCSLCDDHLHKGDPYIFRDGLLLCHADFQHHHHHRHQQQQIFASHYSQSTIRCDQSKSKSIVVQTTKIVS